MESQSFFFLVARLESENSWGPSCLNKLPQATPATSEPMVREPQESGKEERFFQGTSRLKK